MAQKPMDLAAVKELLTKPAPPKTKRQSRKLDTKDRSLTNWFKFSHQLNPDGEFDCSNPNCLCPPEARGKRPTSEIDGTRMCRYCFVGGYDL